MFWMLTGQLNKPQSGLSLIESTLQLMILTTVTVPMVMMVNLQKDTLVENEKDVISQVIADQLFDNVYPQAPFPKAYEVLGPDDGVAPTSIYCDPATLSKEGDGGTFSATCGALAPNNEDIAKGPFFERDVEYVNNGPTIKVTVKLYEDQTVGGTPTYVTSREYDIDNYRVMALNVGLDTRAFSNTVLSTQRLYLQEYHNNFARYYDSEGNPWFGIRKTGVGEPAFTRHDPIGCAGASTELNSAWAPYGGRPLTGGTHGAAVYYLAGAGGNCVISNLDPATAPGDLKGTYYVFKVRPNTKYDVKVRYVLPSAVFMGGMTGTNLTTALSSVRIFSNAGTPSTPLSPSASTYLPTSTLLQGFPNFDVGTAGAQWTSTSLGHGPVLSSTVETPSDSQYLIVNVGASTTNSTVYIAGIEVSRRADL